MHRSSVYAGDLARDLGFKSMTPAFWRWCSENGLEAEFGKPFCFDGAKVQALVSSMKLGGHRRKARKRGGAGHVG